MRTRVPFLLAVLALTVSSAVAQDWTHWRGPEQNGISRETGLPDSWSLETRENVLWSDDIGGRATPVIMNDRVYLNSRTVGPLVGPGKVDLQEQVVCRDLNTGKVLWRDVFNVFQTDIPAPRVGWASMTADPETKRVYMHSVSGLFRCYDEAGKVMWEHSLFEDFGKISGYGGRTQTAVIDENRVIVGFFFLNWGKTGNPPPKQTYFAFDKETGKLLWQSAPGGRPLDTNYSNPFVTVIDGVRQLIGGNADGGVYGINARTGEKLWGMRMSKRGLNTTAAVDGNLVFIAHGEDNIDSTEFGRIQCVDASKRGDFTESGGVWRHDGVKIGYTGLLVKDGVLYAVADTGKMYAYDTKSGELLWDYSVGTVGKGSPVWADGKIYVMEVNGNIHILKADRNGCESLSKVSLKVSDDAAKRGFKGMDEIYASPAISNGKVVFVTRDRTICIGLKSGNKVNEPMKLAAERPATDKIAHVKLVPYEARLMDGGNIEYEVHAFDENGRFIKTMPAENLTIGDSLPGAKGDGSKVTVDTGAKEQAGEITTKVGDLTATARLRVFAAAPWNWDFDGYKGLQVPPTWVNATKKLFPTDLNGEKCMVKKSVATGAKGRPSAYIWMGPSTMKDYTVQADVLMTEKRRQIPAVGVTVNRYNIILDGNKYKFRIQSWAPHKRMAKEIRYKSKTDTWYTVKATVEVKDGTAHVKGKVWKRGDDEPEKWTLEVEDPHANENGAPGLYFYSLANSYIDNVKVTSNK